MPKKDFSQIKSKQRVKENAEVFTSSREVNAMLDLVKGETERIEARFLEPSCGTGNFLVEILSRKLKIVSEKYSKNQSDWERFSIVAISNIYGIEMLEDNVKECRGRLQMIFNEQYEKLYAKDSKDTLREVVKFLLSKNIVCGNTLTYETGDSNEPEIVFSEWVFNDILIKRSDFLFRHLVD